MSGPTRLVVNGFVYDYDIDGPATLFELIGLMGLAGKKLVAEVNGDIVKQDRFCSRSLMDGDRIELIKFVGGG